MSSAPEIQAGERADPIPGFNGGYHEHAVDSPDAWIAQNFARCCGKNDCIPIQDGGVMRNADGSFTILDTGETFTWNDPQVESSQDGTYWRCRNMSGQAAGKTRCLFVPPFGV
jgi:hypothetical protein